MNIYGIGTDIVNIDRIKKIFRQRGDTFKNKVYTNFEISKCNKRKNKNECFAKRFAAKEALSKALGTGIRKGINFKDIEIVNDTYGKPFIRLKGSTASFLKKKIKNKNYSIYLSLSDDDPWAQATVVVSYN